MTMKNPEEAGWASMAEVVQSMLRGLIGLLSKTAPSQMGNHQPILHGDADDPCPRPWKTGQQNGYTDCESGQQNGYPDCDSGKAELSCASLGLEQDRFSSLSGTF